MWARMARAPFQVLVYPYCTAPDGKFEYLLLKRADGLYWQGIAGGGEGGEMPLEAARRETLEETGIPEGSRFLQLISVLPVPAAEFKCRHLWGRDMCMIPQYCFGVLAEKREIVLSSEHVGYRWVKYGAACRLMRYESDKIALWELDERLKKKKRE